MSETAIEWTSHPARARPAAALFAVACLVVTGFLVGQLSGEWLWGALSMVGLFLSLSRFFLASRFRVTPEAVEVAHPLSRSSLPWSEVHCVYWRESRALIARNDTTRARARGITLDFAGVEAARREQLREFVQLRVAKEAWR